MQTQTSQIEVTVQLHLCAQPVENGGKYGQITQLRPSTQHRHRLTELRPLFSWVPHAQKGGGSEFLAHENGNIWSKTPKIVKNCLPLRQNGLFDLPPPLPNGWRVSCYMCVGTSSTQHAAHAVNKKGRKLVKNRKPALGAFRKRSVGR